MLDLEKLRVFDASAQAGSFSAAAERLYITQSAVSQHIKDLEAALGQTLFLRDRRGVRLTAAGEALARYARQIVTLAAQAEAELTEVAALRSGRLLLGATPGVAIYLAPDWVQAFRARYPALSVSLQTGVTSQITAEVAAGRLEVGVVEGEVEAALATRLEQRTLAEVEQVLAVGFKHPFWDEDEVTTAALAEQSFIVRQPGSHSRAWQETAFRALGIPLHIGAEFDHLESIKRAVALGQCLALLPPYAVAAEVAQHLLHTVRVQGAPFRRRLMLLWRADAPPSPISRAFIELVERVRLPV